MISTTSNVTVACRDSIRLRPGPEPFRDVSPYHHLSTSAMPPLESGILAESGHGWKINNDGGAMLFRFFLARLTMVMTSYMGRLASLA